MTRFPNRGFIALAGTLLLTVAANQSTAQSFSVLHNFGSVTGDPQMPSYSGVVAQGRDGNLYTTAQAGGTGKGGAVFKVTPGGTFTVLYNFDGTHGVTPYGGVTLGTDGNFYGTTTAGGSGCCGVVFKITPGGAATVLHSFGGTTDGGVPEAPPIQGADGNFYGTTAGPVPGAPCGTVYKVTPAGVLTTLFIFPAAASKGCNSFSPLVQGTDGNLYGTTTIGGSNGDGVVFKITPSGQLTVLFNFDKTHGSQPIAPVIQASDGNFYGTTAFGGAHNGGVVFRMTPGGVVSVLHSFNGNPDGAHPNAGLVQGNGGNLYGAAGELGAKGFGTIYQISLSGGYSVLYNFDDTTGAYPNVTLVEHTNGSFYSDTTQGGTGNVSPCTTGTCGVFYSLSEGLGPFAGLVSTSGTVGKSIGILGQGFTGTTRVSFRGAMATFKVVSDTYLTAAVPSGAETGSVSVTTPGRTLTSTKVFRVTPQAKSFLPTSGPVGTSVTITGVRLTQTTLVTFGGVKATIFKVNSDTQVTATVPTGAKTGKIGITTAGGTASSPTSFTVTP